MRDWIKKKRSEVFFAMGIIFLKIWAIFFEVDIDVFIF